MKVTFESTGTGTYNIGVNGKLVGVIWGGRGEYTVRLISPEFPEASWVDYTNSTQVARFKYANAKACAKDWAKFVLSRWTVSEIISGVKETTPVQFAQKAGYVHYNVRKAERRERAQAARTPSIESYSSRLIEAIRMTAPQYGDLK
jgi:hypothetical protein